MEMWNLASVARCPALQAFLSAAEQRSVAGVVGSGSSGTSGAAAAAPAAPEAANAAQADAFPTSAHLERWRTWKLADEHIEQLTAAERDAEAMRSLETRVRSLGFFARGKRGVLYACETLGEQSRPVVAKLAAAGTEAQSSVAAEAKWLRVMNRMGVGAELLDAGPGWFLIERLDGVNVVEFLGDESTTTADALWVVREMLAQCFTMDRMNVNKEEMTHPHRHIIISRKRSGQGWRCTFIDFEKCQHSKKPKNVTQLCQFLSSPRMVALLLAKRVAVDVPKLRQCTKRYKQSLDSRSLDAIVRVFSL